MPRSETSQYTVFQGTNKVALLSTGDNSLLTGGLFDYTESSTITGHPAKNEPVTIDLVNFLYNEDLETLFATYLNTADTEPKQKTCEDGSIVTFSGVSDDVERFLVVHYTNKVNGKRAWTVGEAVLTGDTGNMEFAAGEPAKTPITIRSVPASTTYTLTTTSIYSAVGIAPASSITVTSGSYGTRVVLADA